MSPELGRCRGTKRNGEPCTLPATGTHGYCWAHNPANAEKRRRMASKAARAKPITEVHTIKEEIRRIISDVRGGELDRNDASTMIGAYRALREFMELERRVRETEELAEEIEELKREYGSSA
jgi:hypothetical protein